jgi:hypothetical protein
MKATVRVGPLGREIKAGRDPRRPRRPQKPLNAAPTDVASFLDAFVERCVKPAELKGLKSICSRIDVLKKHLGALVMARDSWSKDLVFPRTAACDPHNVLLGLTLGYVRQRGQGPSTPSDRRRSRNDWLRPGH